MYVAEKMKLKSLNSASVGAPESNNKPEVKN